MEDYILEVKDLNKSYKKFQLKNINLLLERGKIMGFIGPNGSGKSTTIKSIMDIISYDNGTIMIDKKNMKDNEIELKQLIGYVGEHLDFYEKVKLDKIYKFTRKFYVNWDENLFKALIKRFDIDLDKKMKDLSKGMVVKFSLAMALAHHPKLFILDEPTSGLDPVVRHVLLEILSKTVRDEHASILFSSHITEDIVKIADEVVFIYDGEIKLVENKATILEDYLMVGPVDLLDNIDAGKIILRDKKKAIINKRVWGPTHNGKWNYERVSLDELLLFIIDQDKTNGGQL